MRQRSSTVRCYQTSHRIGLLYESRKRRIIRIFKFLYLRRKRRNNGPSSMPSTTRSSVLVVLLYKCRGLFQTSQLNQGRRRSSREAAGFEETSSFTCEEAEKCVRAKMTLRHNFPRYFRKQNTSVSVSLTILLFHIFCIFLTIFLLPHIAQLLFINLHHAFCWNH
jgi:hypothetical protein